MYRPLYRPLVRGDIKLHNMEKEEVIVWGGGKAQE